MQSASQKRSVTALILGLALSALLIAICGAESPGEQLPWFTTRQDFSSARAPLASASIRGTSAPISTAGVFPTQAAPALGLTLADFTGDTHPDLATVQLDRVDAENAHYSLDIRLTEGGRQILRLTAPFGGLMINPKDVTGDGNLDLVIQSTRTRRVVAVFLNDGHGHFNPAEIAHFSKALASDSFPFSLTRKPAYPGTTFACPESHGIEYRTRWLGSFLAQNGSLLPPNYDAISQRVFPFGSNRAPPSLA
jgi:hypothetical protein